MKPNATIAAANPVEDFAAAITGAGVEILNLTIIPDGKIHRVKVEGDKSGERSGWYVFYGDDLPAGAFGDWRKCAKGTWCAKGSSEQTPEERAAFARRMEEARAQREAEVKARHEEARRKAAAFWSEAKPAPADHPYLRAKKIQPHGSKVDAEGNLILGLRDAEGQIWTTQRISPQGEKLLQRDGRAGGSFYAIGTAQDVERSGKIGFSEGFATGAAVREATSFPLICAMSAGNLKTVALAEKQKYPKAEFLFFADNDASGRGEEAAREAAQVVGGIVVVCPEPGDFNDLAQANGVEAVRAVIEAALKSPDPERNGKPKKRSEGLEEWPEPEPLFRPLPPGESFPLEALGEVLGGGARAIAEIRRVPEGAAAQSILAAASLATQPHADVEIDGQRQPIGIFLLTILPSGEGKSVADAAALAPAEKTQARLMEQYRAEAVPKHLRDLALWEDGKKRALHEKTPTDRGAALDEIGDEPKAPAPPILLASDPTYEGLTRIYAAGWATIALVNDEGGGFLGGWAMSAEQRLGTLARLSRLWDRGEVERLRSGGVQGRFPGCRFTFHLMLQPYVSSDLIADPIAQNQGFLARCLMAAPEPLPAKARQYTARDVRDDPRYQTYSSRMLALLERPLPWHLDTQGRRIGLEPCVLKPNAAARKIWIGLHNWVLQNIDADGPLATVREAANKAAQQALRLAAILTLSNDPNAAEIGPCELKGAAILARYYLSEALRLTGAATQDSDLLLAARLQKWLWDGGAVRLDDGRSVVWPVHVYQTGPSPLRAKAVALRILGILEAHGWLRRIGATEAGGGKRNILWEVRPDAE